MCKPVDQLTKRVVISGAGPAGLLLTALLLKRNADTETPSPITYHVTLVDNRQNFGKVSKEGMAKFRSWMIGLANHGLDALREIPELHNDYVQGIGVKIDSLGIFLGSKKIEQTAEDMENAPEAYIVDRNFIVAAIARYINDVHGEDDNLTLMFDHKLQYVDYENSQVLVRSTEDASSEEYVDYDLLIGCDGIRSVVREALIKRHSDFECDIGDIFQQFKAVHVDMPEEVGANSMSLLPDCLPEMMGIALPETGGKVNISMGVPRSNFHKLADDLKSDDYKVVSKYIKENFKAFELVDYDDFARQWVSQRWNRTGQVHCNFYHSLEAKVVIMGDAAHATSPSIGMGMNTALRDAQIFYNILVQNKDDFEMSLPEFSNQRVKEGNSLTDLAMHLYCFEKGPQLIETIHMVVRGKLHKVLPWLVSEHPQNMIGVRGNQLSDVYAHARSLGIIDKHRRINSEVRRNHFEATVGMMKKNEDKKASASKSLVSIAALGALISAGLYYRQNY